MAVVHAILECDPNRGFTVLEKAAVLKLLSDETFKTNADTFYKRDVSSQEVMDAGENLLLMIFGGRKETLNKLRLSKFYEKVATSTGGVAPESLCPTTDDAGLHCLRVYHQVHAWLGNDIPAVKWG